MPANQDPAGHYMNITHVQSILTFHTGIISFGYKIISSQQYLSADRAIRNALEKGV